MIEWLDRDGKLILAEKAVRTIPYGFLGVLYPVYLTQFGLGAVAIGIVLGLTTASSAIYTLVASLLSDRIGRRRTLVFFALMDALAAVILLSFATWWAPVVAGIVGNMTVGAGEVGPYLSIEQAILPKTSSYANRALTYSWYNLAGYVSSALGALLVGLPVLIGLGRSDYKILFLFYLVSGLAGVFIYSRMSRQTEQSHEGSIHPGRFVSAKSRPLVLKLSALFAVDAFGGGFIGSSIISYYFYERYSLDLASLGIILAAASLITAASFLVSAKVSLKIGFLKTMVYSHLPSNLLLITVPFAPSLSIAVLAYLSRQTLSQMDVPPRQAFVVSVVPEEDRLPASGATNVSRSAASSVSPYLTGYAIADLWIGAPFVIAGALKVGYDLAVYGSFRKTRLLDDEGDSS